MNVNLLIDNVVRQTTILIAQLATSGGVRAPLAHLANQVFVELSKELESQGISKQVTADMFGLALRSYRRRVQRLSASVTDRDRSLWEAVLGYLGSSKIVTRKEVLRRFGRDDENQVRSVLHDLCESGLVFRLGTGTHVAYRAVTTEELSELSGQGENADEIVWVAVYRQGPVTLSELADALCLPEQRLLSSLQRLQTDDRVRELQDGRFQSAHAVMPVGTDAGWEAGMFDHFQAVVTTLCKRLQARDEPSAQAELGGSTYGFNVWPGHPHEQEVRGALAAFRQQYTQLRQRVQAYNQTHEMPPDASKVVLYAGQHITEQKAGNDD